MGAKVVWPSGRKDWHMQVCDGGERYLRYAGRREAAFAAKKEIETSLAVSAGVPICHVPKSLGHGDRNRKPPEGGFRNFSRFNGFFGEPSWDRTNDPLIKSQMLCQLSYGLPRNGSFYVPGGGSVKRGRDSSE